MRKPSAPRPEQAAHTEWNEPGAQEAGPAVGASRSTALEPAAPPDARGSLEVFGRRPPASSADRGPAAQGPGDRVVSTGLTQRLAERRRALRALRVRRLRTGAAVALVLACLVWALGFSPLLGLRVSQVRVTGSDGTVADSQVHELLAGHEGTSLLRLDVADIGRQVADSLVRVRSARVTRSWPHGLEVSLQMRVPVAVRSTEAGYEVLDAQAVVLETASQAPTGLVTVGEEEGAVLGPEQVAALTGALGCLDEGTRAQVVSASISSSGRISMSLGNGSQVHWGDSSQGELKAAVLSTLLSRPAAVYDVSSPHSPTTS